MPARTKAKAKEPPTGVKPGPSSSQNALLAAPTEEHIPFCTLEFEDPVRHRGAAWSQNGQLSVVTDERISVLTPALGLHNSFLPQITTRPVQHELFHASAPSAVRSGVHSDVQPLQFHRSHLDIEGLRKANAPGIEESNRRRILVSGDYDAVIPKPERKTTFLHAAWSPAGLGPLSNCLLATTTSEFDLSILSPVKDPLRGTWSVVKRLDACEGLHDRTPARQRMLADQILCMSWSPLFQQGSDTLSPMSQHASDQYAFLAAGNSLGEVIIWKVSSPSAEDFRLSMTLEKRCAVASEAVTTIAWLTHESAPPSRDPRLSLFAAGASRVHVLDVSVEQGAVQCSHAVAQPPPLLDYPQISEPHLYNGQLIVVSPGTIRIWEASQDHWSHHLLLPPEPLDDGFIRDPCAPVVDLRTTGSSMLLTLSSGLQYRLTFPLADTVVPIRELSTVSHPDFSIRRLSQKVEQRQTLLAWASSGSLGAGLICAVQSSGDISSYRVPADNCSRLTLLLPQSLKTDAVDLIENQYEKAFQDLSSHKVTSAILAFRAMLAFLHSSSQSQQSVLGGPIWTLLQRSATSTELEGSTEEMAGCTRRLGAMCFLAAWLEKQPSEAMTEVSEAGKVKDLRYHLEACVLALWLVKVLSTTDSRKMSTKGPLAQTVNRVFTFLSQLSSTSSSALPRSVSDHLTNLLESSWTKATSSTLQHQPSSNAADNAVLPAVSIPCTDLCPACNSSMTVEWSLGDLRPRWSRCEKGHRVPRCSQTFAILQDEEVKTCVGCMGKSLVPRARQQQQEEEEVNGKVGEGSKGKGKNRDKGKKRQRDQDGHVNVDVDGDGDGNGEQMNSETARDPEIERILRLGSDSCPFCTNGYIMLV